MIFKKAKFILCKCRRARQRLARAEVKKAVSIIIGNHSQSWRRREGLWACGPLSSGDGPYSRCDW